MQEDSCRSSKQQQAVSPCFLVLDIEEESAGPKHRNADTTGLLGGRNGADAGSRGMCIIDYIGTAWPRL